MHDPVSVSGKWQNVVEPATRSVLAQRLSHYACKQRWYRSKGIALSSAEIEDVFLFGAGDHCLLVLRLELVDGATESYVMPLHFLAAGNAERPASPSPLLIELEIHVPGEALPSRGSLLDASASRVFAELLLGLLCEQRPLSGERAVLSGELFAGGTTPGVPLEPHFLTLEQSNSTILFGSSWLLKLLRKIEPGANVELEVGQFLERAVPRPQVPRLVGALQLSSNEGPRTLAVVSEYVENQGSAWSVTLESLADFFERVLADHAAPLTLPSPPAADAEGHEAIPEVLLRLASPYFKLVQRLAERTAELHRALGSPTQDSGFGQEPFTELYQLSLYQGAQRELERCFEQLRDPNRSLPGDAQALANQLLNARAPIEERLRRITQHSVAVMRIRCHGDYHLGQVLFRGDDFTIIDFEGEPGRPLAERREKGSPLRDIAGMLRSFAYAAETALREPRLGPEERARLAPWAEAFRAWVCVSFVQRYFAASVGQAYCPEKRAAARLLLEFYELEKALYEVNYELNNRPHWLAVPLAGLARIARSEP